MLKGQFPSAATVDLFSVNNRQQKTLILDSWTVFVPVDECEVTSDPLVCVNDLSVTARGQKGSRLWRLITKMLISEEKTSAKPKPEPC